MAIEVFNRFEKKFFMNSKTYFRVSEELKKYMELDPYSEVGKGYTISNIYYDTSDDLLVRRSLSKPVYKEKLRLRGYGVPEENGKVYLEIKKKFNGLVNKRRTTLYLNEAYDFKKSVGAYTPMLKRITAKAGSYVEAKEKYSAVRESGNIITADFEQNFSKGYKTANA